jgi:RNA polymerase sigma factor (sigma-70 family)
VDEGRHPREVLTSFPQPRDIGDEHSSRHKQIVEPRQTMKPFTPMEALQCAAPGDVVEESTLESLALRDILADALDELDPRERRLVEARVIEKRSYRSLERELGWRKSHMQRTYKRLLAQLAESLAEVPAIQAYLTRHDPSEEDE